MTSRSSFQVPRKAEALLLIAIVLIAIIFRFAAFKQVPPGLHYDEAIDAKLAREIQSGAWPIYFEEGWGREPLYHYFVAFTLNWAPDVTTALRLVSGVLGLIQLLAAYFLFRKMFGVPTALIGAAWIAVLFWTVSTSRAGLRNITLTTFATLTALAFWSAYSKMRQLSSNGPGASLPPASFILPGVLLGLTLYTYQPSRVVPLIYLVFVLYLFWRERALLKANWKALLVFFAAAAILALPLMIFLAAHPTAETGRAFQTEPIRAMVRGDFNQVFETATATLKMFTFEGGGDPQPLYNIVGRPLFIGLGSLLFLIGVVVCLARFKRPANAFMLIWLIVTLLPNMVTAPAPFFYRAIAAQTPALLMPALGTVAIGELIHRSRAKRSQLMGGIVIATIAVVSLGQTAITTWRDYFEVWGTDPYVRFQYSAAHTAIGHTLDASADTTPVAISGYFVEDADPIIFDQTLKRRDLSLRWFDAREALVAAPQAETQRIATPSFAPLDDVLLSRFLNNVEPITGTKDFKIYPFDPAQFRTQIETWDNCVTCPIAFDGNVALLGIDRPGQVVRAAGTLPILTAWHVLREGQPTSTAIFAHLLDASGQVAAQDDRLGFPRHSWQAGDEFVQLHQIPIGNLPPGKYTLEIGIYNRDDNVRWKAQDQAGRPIGDRVLLGTIEVLP